MSTRKDLLDAINELIADGLVEHKRDENGRLAYRNGQPIYVPTARAMAEDNFNPSNPLKQIYEAVGLKWNA
jgi:hypothetical protein